MVFSGQRMEVNKNVFTAGYRVHEVNEVGHSLETKVKKNRIKIKTNSH